MGYELWTSPVTGYRRRGTRLSELRALFDTGITAHAIVEPLMSCPSVAPAREMAQELKRRDFDIAGVQDDEDSPPIGFVIAEELTEGSVADWRHDLTTDVLIGDSTPLVNVLSTLAGRPYAFVFIGPEVRAIVARADLNKPPVRIFLFGLVSLFEMHITFWIRQSYKEDSWEKQLTPGRVKKASALFETKRQAGHQVDLLDCLQMADKIELACRSKSIVQGIGLPDTSAGIRGLKKCEKLRNSLAHSESDLVQDASWSDMAGVVGDIERIVTTSDGAVAGLFEPESGHGSHLLRYGHW